MTATSNTPPVRLAFVLCLLLIFVLSGPTTSAQNPSDAQGPGAGGKEYITVVGHLPLDNMPVNRMFVQQRGEKVYLFLHRPTKDAFAVVEVTRPDRPVLLDRSTMKETRGTLFEPGAPGSAFALTVTPEGDSSAPESAAPAKALPTETVNFVDMSDPKNGKTVKTFKGVTAIYPDDARHLVYLVNSEGLWIVRHRMVRPLPLCTSSAALNPEPDCQ
jgi:hypothetical protein